MPTEVWFRNPDNYIKEVAEVGALRVAWDRGYLVKRNLDPIKYLELHLGSGQWETALVGTQGTSIYGYGDTLDKPRAVYPTWAYGEDAIMLEEIVENPVGQDPTCYNDLSCEQEFRPVKGQPHVVVVTDLPASPSGPGRQFLSYLKVLQEDNPDCTIWIHGLYSYRAMFGMGWKRVDVDPRSSAQKGRVFLASGREVTHEQTVANSKWVTPLGFLPVDLKVPRNRCMFNMKSALWAGENWEKVYAFPIQNRGQEIDIESSDDDHKPVETSSPFSSAVKVKDGDQFYCNTCSLQDKCKYFRDGAVCTVPGAEPQSLAKMFKSRDSDQIIDGLSTLVAAGATRLERGMRTEEAMGDLDPAVSKAMGQVFAQGVQLAKLVDPSLRGGPGVQVNVNGNGQTAIVAGTDPRKLVATVVRELESRGIPRDKQTPEMIQGVIEGMRDPANAQRAIESPIQGTVLGESA